MTSIPENRGDLPSSRPHGIPDSWRAALGTALALAVVYGLTLAPGLTLWDAGEFQSAVASLGIPHPPGAPLYILIGRVWTTALHGVPLPVALNALSAVATLAACSAVAALFARWLRSAWAGAGAGIIGGLTFSLWQNATETEVYALSLLLGVLVLAAGERAGESHAVRWSLILAYLLGLAGPLHLDALVAAPAAIVLAASGPSQTPSLRALLPLAGVLVAAVGLGRGAPLGTLAGAGIVVASVWAPLPGRWQARALRALGLLFLVALGASAWLFLLLRAPHDPSINQGNPETWRGMLDVIARAQYDVPGLWPRRAPVWLQSANVMQYGDWQVAFGVDDWPGPSWPRTSFSTVFLLLAIAGARAHARLDGRSFRAWATYLLAGSLGVMVVLNLLAGPSIGWGVLDAGAGHEARERDYFFTPAFLAAGAWAAVGAWSLGRRLLPRAPGVVVLIAAAIPLLGNWPATDRRREPEASLATRLADALLASAPPNAVLLLGGDNDTYAIWQSQVVRGLRRDVAPVTLPLLAAEWYRAELARRHRLFTPPSVAVWRGDSTMLREIAMQAAADGRPLAAAVSVPWETRGRIAPRWALHGMVYVSDSGRQGSEPDRVLSVDRASTERVAGLIVRAAPRGAAEGRDAASRYIDHLLRCPRQVLESRSAAGRDTTGSLDSICNFR
jgi:hypothetical protein